MGRGYPASFLHGLRGSRAALLFVGALLSGTFAMGATSSSKFPNQSNPNSTATPAPAETTAPALEDAQVQSEISTLTAKPATPVNAPAVPADPATPTAPKPPVVMSLTQEVAIHPTTIQKYTLKTFLDAVMARSPGILSAQLDSESADYAWKSARVSYFPKLTANGDLQYVKGTQIDPLANSAVNNGHQVNGFVDGGGGTLLIPVYEDGTFFGINTPPRAEISRQFKKIADANIVLTKDQIRFRATGVFLQAIVAQREVAYLDEETGALTNQVKMLHAQEPYHLVAPEQIANSQSQLDQAEALRKQSQWLAASAFVQVSVLLGLDDATKIRIKDEYPEVANEPEFKDVIDKALMSHPLLSIQQAQIAQATAQHALDESAVLPKVQLGGTYSYADNYDPPGQDRWVGALSVTMPIIDFGKDYYTIRSSSKKMEEEKQKLYQVKEDLVRTLQDSFSALEVAKVSYISSQATLGPKKLVLDKYDVEHQHGQADEVGYLAAKIDYATSAVAAETNHYQLLLAYASLEEASSGAWKWIQK